MKEDLIADIWTMVVEHIPEKQRKDAAADFVNLLLDHNIKESTISSLLGVDSYLDDAIEYVIDDFDDQYYDEDEDE